MSTLNEIALAYAKKQPKQVDYITENSPIINSIPYYPTTHGLRHAYEVLESITGGNFVNMDDQLPTVSTQSRLDWKELSILGGQIEVGEDKAKQLGGAAKYFASKMPNVYRQTSMDAEMQLIYNLITPFAQKNKKLVSSTSSPSGNNYYSILVVRWQEEEFCGLFDPKGFAKGTMFDFLPFNGGNVYKNKDDVAVYGARFKSYLGFLLANSRNVAGIVNIDANAEAPDGLSSQLSDALIEARAGQLGTTKIYAPPAMIGKLSKFKDSKLSVTNGDKGIDRRITYWDGVEMIPSYNFLQGKEAPVTLL
jgi:hypothetical protein